MAKRLGIKRSTLKRLFAVSGNECAFPDCRESVVDGFGNLIVDVCHIEAAEEAGERYNPLQSDEERRRYENLLLLCPTHHRVTNNVAEYPVARLQRMKAGHEACFKGQKSKLSEVDLQRATRAAHRLHRRRSEVLGGVVFASLHVVPFAVFFLILLAMNACDALWIDPVPSSRGLAISFQTAIWHWFFLTVTLGLLFAYPLSKAGQSYDASSEEPGVAGLIFVVLAWIVMTIASILLACEFLDAPIPQPRLRALIPIFVVGAYGGLAGTLAVAFFKTTLGSSPTSK